MAYSHQKALKRAKKHIKQRIEIMKKNGDNNNVKRYEARLVRMDKL